MAQNYSNLVGSSALNKFPYTPVPASPAQTALNTKLSISPYAGLTSNNFSIGGSTTPAISPTVNTNLSPSQPSSGAIKKQTVTEYHPPATATPTTQPLASNNSGGTSNPNFNLQTNTGNAPAGTPATNTGLVSNPSGTPTYPGLISNLSSIGNEGSSGYNKAVENLATFNRNLAQKYGDIESTPIPLVFQQGREQVLARQAASEQAALQGAVTQQQTQQGQQINALGTAAGLLSPVQVPYSNQFVNPATGLPVGGGATGGSLNDAVTSVATKVKNGSMSYNDALSALGGYGQGGVNALQQALGPNFNINASNANASSQANTVAQSGTLQKASEAATSALDTLQQAYNALGSLQKTSMPFVNAIANYVSSETGAGRTPTSNYGTVLSDARNQLLAVLNASGGTPTGNEATTNEYLPANMTPSEIPTKIAQAKNLIAQRIQAYSSNANVPGFNNTQNNGQQSTNIYSF